MAGTTPKLAYIKAPSIGDVTHTMPSSTLDNEVASFISSGVTISGIIAEEGPA